METEPEILNKVFRNPDLAIIGGALVDQLLNNLIRSAPDFISETPEQQRKKAREVFGNDYRNEYSGE